MNLHSIQTNLLGQTVQIQTPSGFTTDCYTVVGCYGYVLEDDPDSSPKIVLILKDDKGILIEKHIEKVKVIKPFLIPLISFFWEKPKNYKIHNDYIKPLKFKEFYE